MLLEKNFIIIFVALVMVIAIVYVVSLRSSEGLADATGTASTALSGSYDSILVSDSPTGNMAALAFPKGIIVLWSGEIGKIPAGWALCDGKEYNGIKTPNLQGRFVRGYKEGQPKEDGSATAKLEERHIPVHTHYTNIIAGSASGSGNYVDAGGWHKSGANIRQIRTDGGSGNGEPFDIIPPYYTLAYIMKYI